MKILFHSNQLGYRGTEVALYDYAHYNRELLGNESIIVSPRNARGSSPEIVQRFMNRFRVLFYDTPADLDRIASDTGADMLYCIKSGKNDGIISRMIKTCVHAVFMESDFHGDVYAYVSEWLSNRMSQGQKPFVPHIVSMPKVDNDFREFLGIPRDAVVFGRYGGNESFDIKFARKAVIDIARKRKDIYFLFMSTDRFHRPVFGRELPNLIHLPGTSDLRTKSAFINTCDAMLHARQRGETFGLAIGEFSMLGKRVITFQDSPERAHIEILKSKALYYRDYKGLAELLHNFRPDGAGDYDCYSTQFSPEQVMERFKAVFIDS